MASFFKKFLYLAGGVLMLVLALEIPHWGVEWFQLQNWSAIGRVSLQGVLILAAVAFFIGGVEIG